MEYLRCTFGPRLRSSNMSKPEPAYVPPKWERWGDNLVLGTSSAAWALLTSLPILLLLVLRLLWQLRWKDDTYLSIVTIVHTSALSRLVYFLGFLRVSGQVMRGIGRTGSTEYIRWHQLYRGAGSGQDDMRRQLQLSDWEPRPIDYIANRSAPGQPRKFLPPAAVTIPPGWQGVALRVPGISNQIAKTLARRLIYPGSVFFLQRQMQPFLLQGRGQLVQQHCQRFCVKSRAGNTIDCMLCDRRGRSSVGERLFITSEGNASFYEMGNMTGAMQTCRSKGGCSVLGWNHPGFGASSGTPSPQSEAHAIDAMLEFAQDSLGYALDNIVLHGWSIGGYATSWAAMNHPGIRGVLLDAPFDDLAPLAERIVPSMLPTYFLPFTEVVLRRHYNLDVAAQLSEYKGPLVIVRRLQDEVISGGRPQELAQNRTNDLLAKFLAARYGTDSSDWGPLPPNFAGVTEWLNGFLGSPISAADASVTPQQKEDLAKAVGLNASVEAMRRVERHLVSVNKNHTAPLDSLDEAVAKLEAQRSSSRSS